MLTTRRLIIILLLCLLTKVHSTRDLWDCLHETSHLRLSIGEKKNGRKEREGVHKIIDVRVITDKREKMKACVERDYGHFSFHGRVDMREICLPHADAPFIPLCDSDHRKDIQNFVRPGSNWSLERIWQQEGNRYGRRRYYIYMFCKNDGSKEIQLFTVMEHGKNSLAFFYIPYQNPVVRIDMWNDVRTVWEADNEREQLTQEGDSLKQEGNEQREEIEQLKLVIDQLEQEKIAAGDQVNEERKQNDRECGIVSCTVGEFMLVIGYFVVALKWRAKQEMSEEMREELNAQRKRILTPHELVPVVPSVHANRLGVHENPAVRDVFGMKEPWDVTPGEGFHVARITAKQETTRGIISEGTDEGDHQAVLVSGDEGK